MSHAAAARAASTAAYEYTGRTDALTAGHPASVVFFEDDPWSDVAILERPSLVIHRGTIVHRSHD